MKPALSEASVHRRFRSARSHTLRAAALLAALGVFGGCYGVDSSDRAALGADAGLSARPGTTTATGAAMDAGDGSRVIADAGPGALPPLNDGAPSDSRDAANDVANDAANVDVDAGTPGGGGFNDPDSGVWVYPVLANMSCRDVYTDTQRNHDVGYDQSDVHGLDAVLAGSDCRSCHGDNLEGCARAPSCNGCHNDGHQPGWQTDCTYCHGIADNDTGAPPRFLDGNDPGRPSNTFLVHTEHVTQGNHPAYDCVQCHVKPENVLSKGHMFDLENETPGVAEVVFTGGLSNAGSFANGTCSTLYCHGNGRSNGNVAHTVTELTCTSCHADRTQPTQLGGSHPDHLTTTEGGLIRCAECHADVISTGDSVITGPTRHVDGKKDVRMPSGITMNASKTCTGSCHGFTHGGLFFPTRTW